MIYTGTVKVECHAMTLRPLTFPRDFESIINYYYWCTPFWELIFSHICFMFVCRANATTEEGAEQNTETISERSDRTWKTRKATGKTDNQLDICYQFGPSCLKFWSSAFYGIIVFIIKLLITVGSLSSKPICYVICTWPCGCPTTGTLFKCIAQCLNHDTRSGNTFWPVKGAC